MGALLFVMALICLAGGFSCFFGEDKGAVDGSNSQLIWGFVLILLALGCCMLAIYLSRT